MIKIGRNDPCHCGSGKKYKKCCLLKDQLKAHEESMPFEDYFVDLPPSLGARKSNNTETTDDYWYESRPGRMRSKHKGYGDLSKKLPKISREQKKIIEDWWDDVTPYYDDLNTTEMTARVISFMEEHPELFVHLELHWEFLFELGGELARRQQWPDYIDLLTRIRKEHPEMYEHSFGYYDYQILTYLISSNQREKISEYFSFFRKYPLVDPDNAWAVINLLAWTGMDEEFFAFLDIVALRLWRALHISCPNLVIFWKIFKEYIPFLNSSESAILKAPKLLDKIKAARVPIWSKWNEAFLRRELTNRHKTPKAWDISTCGTEEEVNFFYHDLAWNFCGFLHDLKDMGWIRARFLAFKLEDYWTDLPKGKRPKEPFRLVSQHIEKYIQERCKVLLYINGISAVSFLQTIWYFADYLFHYGWVDKKDVQKIQSLCLKLHEKYKKMIDDLDAMHMLISDLPEMVVGS